MLLQNRTAIVYGAAGSVGAAVSRAFAREGAVVFLTGRRSDGLAELADEIVTNGGRAEVAVVDALSLDEVERHAAKVVTATGGVDVSFNAVSIRGDLQGKKLVDMSVEDFTTPIHTAATANFLTATVAARHMVQKGSGVILTMSTSGSRLSGRDQSFHATGGFGVACGAVETLTRNLAGELGPAGVRVVCLRPDALPETWPIEEFAASGGDTAEINKIKSYMESGTSLRRLPRLAEVAETAAFMASDRASATTGTVVNLTCGSVLD
ncbi:MAG TPA: SDR family oxidoreductase [Mycobacteriales bacterium]|jgi:NAD(P)-dependent dehydrogenase (short-subunit alcohol dehydrogenase family)|nr:SDR family oxidoreductase [Mycobacteriales bacterium]